jgi:signal transduction histidine kinase
MEAIGPAAADLERHLERQQRTQERQLVGVRIVMVALAAGFVLVFRERLPSLPVLLAILGVVVAYSVAVPLLLRRFPSREVGIVTTGLDMTAVTVAVYAAPEATDAYLFYGLVILGAALRFGLAASVWASLLVSAMYVAVVLAGTAADAPARALIGVRVAYLIGFGVVAGLFSRVVIGRATENARLQARLAQDEREQAAVRERELLSRLGRDFGESLDRGATVRAVVTGASPHLGDAAILYTLEPDGARLRAEAAAGRDPELADRLLAFATERCPRVGEGIAGAAAATTTPLVAAASDDDGGASADPDGLQALGLGWVLAAPILAGGRVLGVLATVGDGSQDRPPEEIGRLTEAIAERAGPALQNAALWADLQEQMTREQQAQRIKDDFLSIVSHELRTPLTSIQGYTQLLEGRLRVEAAAESKEMAHLRVIRSQVGRMRRLVDDLLDVSRIDRRGGVSVEPGEIDLGVMVREAVARAQREHRDRPIRLEAPETLTIQADHDRIDQVLTNLLENAVKYSPDGGPIEVRAEPRGAEVQVSVADTGVGIHPDQLELVFDRFYQADDDAPRRRFGGLGLGLYISRAIVEAHGGRIWAAPNVAAGVGTVFSFRLPRLARVQPEPSLPAAGEPPPFVLRRRDRAS